MSGVGFSELILVFLIGLIVLGPERLPRVAHQLGTWLGQARRMTRMMKRQLEEELNLEQQLNIRPPPRVLPRATRPAREERPAAAAGSGTADARKPSAEAGPGQGDEAGSVEPRAQDKVS
jgi:sec-independent protein translocase protein TatB